MPGQPDDGRTSLTPYGESCQDGGLNQMNWKTSGTIDFLFGHLWLAGGNVILAGTPSGVAAVVVGDRMVVMIDGLGELAINVVRPRSD